VSFELGMKYTRESGTDAGSTDTAVAEGGRQQMKRVALIVFGF